MAFRIGLHTGLVVVGGVRDDTELSAVVGDVVSVAMVLQEQAAPRQILCSDTTARLVRGWRVSKPWRRSSSQDSQRH